MEVTTYNASPLEIHLMIIVAFNLNDTIISPQNYISSLCSEKPMGEYYI
jgi:hypothetical protein